MNLFNLLLASLIIGILIFISTQNFLFNFSQSIRKEEFIRKVENFLSTLERISKIDAESFYHEYFFGLANISIKNNVLKIVSGSNEFSYYLPFNVEDSEIINKGRICIIKTENNISIQACDEIKYIIDGICTPLECKINSPDCKGPNGICINDGYCNTFIGENCKNSNDCLDPNGVCCPEDPSANEKGITNRYNLKEGEECYCDNQCSSNLKCNEVDPNFKGYKSNKACCPEGTRWDGNKCVEVKKIEAFDVFIVPVGLNANDQDKYLSAALSFMNHFLSVSPFRECKNRDELIRFWIINISDCPDEASTQCSHHCYDCISIGRKCARKWENKLGINYDKFVVFTRGGGWRGGCAGNIPYDGSSNSLLDCSSYLCIPSHEIGHNLGLGHVNCGVDCHACLYYPFFNGPAPNCPDCNHPERASFIMDYCRPDQRYGPAAYNFLANNFIGTPPHAAGLGEYMKECIR